jgi:ribosome-associated protein
MNHDDFDPSELPPSRSQQRRDALDVLELAEKLVAMTATQLREVPLSERVLDAVKQAQQITSHIAHKRQVHFLAKQMRKEGDLDPIRLAVDKPLEVRRKETATLHLLERWRERLVSEGDPALNALIEEFPSADRSHLRQLIRQAQIERRDQRAPSAQRSIFQVLKGLLRGDQDEPDHTPDPSADDAE